MQNWPIIRAELLEAIRHAVKYGFTDIETQARYRFSELKEKHRKQLGV